MNSRIRIEWNPELKDYCWSWKILFDGHCLSKIFWDGVGLPAKRKECECQYSYSGKHILQNDLYNKC